MEKIRKRLPALLAIAFALTGFGCAESDRPTLFVSLVQLMTNPGDYDGYPVSVSGYLAENGSFLYLSADHAKMNDVAGGLPITISYSDVDISEHGLASTSCENQFVRVLGVFTKRNAEYAIRSIERIYAYDESAGLQFEGQEPSGGPAVCWPN